jgi:predicted transposase YbfD/YdcC
VRELLGRLDLVGKTVVADALHTQIETAQQIVFERGGDYLLSVKDNQKTLHQSVASLLEKQAFSPCPHAAQPPLPA